MAGTGAAMLDDAKHDLWMVLLTAIVTALASRSFASAPSLARRLRLSLRDIDPTIIQDIRYADSNNFIGRPLAGYGAANAW